MESKSRVVFCILLILSLGSYAAALSTRGITVSDDPVDYWDSFEVTAELGGDTCSLVADFYVDDFRFARQNVGCGDNEITGKFDLDKDDWELRGITCGPHKARVELLRLNTIMLNDSVDFNIGTVPDLEFTPLKPTPGKDVRVKLKDPDTGNVLKTVDVRIRDQFGGDPVSRRTGGDGTFTFKPNVAGEYTMSVLERDYCGDIKFYIKRPMIVDGPHPENPVVNENILIAVPTGASVGVKVIDSAGELYQTVPVSYNGGANFTISDPGDYTIVVGELSTRYWSLNKTLTVSERPVPEITIAPEQPVVGKPITITVKSRDDPLQAATVAVQKPDGVEREYTTSSGGTVNYDAVTATGEYTIRVSKAKYETVSDTFEAYHGFNVVLEPESPTVQDTITMTVNDQDGNPVGDALVEIPEAGFRRVTDMGGRLTLNLQEPREHSIQITKDLFWDKTVQLTPYGMLSIGDCVSEFELGNSVTISVFDNFNDPITADIKVTDPDGIVRYYSSESQTITPEKPGSHVVTVSKTNYLSANTTFTVTPHPLELTSTMDSGRLFINVTSRGEGVPGLRVSVARDGTVLNGTTNDEGVVSFEMRSEGNLTVTVNQGAGNRVYEEKVVDQQVVRAYNLVLLTTPLLLIGGITFLTILAIQLGRHYFGREWKLPERKKKKVRGKSRHDSSLMGGEGKGGSRLSDI